MQAANRVARLHFRTSRLVMKPLVAGDGKEQPEEPVQTAVSALLTPEVLKHLPEPLQMPGSAAPVGAWLAARLAESFLYAVHEKTAAELNGLLILADTSEFDATPTLRLGYLFAQPAWGQGYATELVAGLVRELRSIGWGGQLLAGVSRANPGSSRVLLKAGFVEIPAEDAASQSFRIRFD